MSRPRHAAPRRSPAVKVLLCAAGFVLASSGAALAYFVVNVLEDPGSYASTAAASLAAPIGAVATEASSTAVQVSWTEPAHQVAGASYQVTASPGPATCSTSGSSCTLTGLSGGTRYAFSVAAVLHDWVSSPSTTSLTTLGVVTASLPAGTVGHPYSARLDSIGGNTGPVTWTLSTGTLPPGLTLDPSTGVIAGTPTTTGTASGLEFTVTDAKASAAASAQLSLGVTKGDQHISFTSTTPGQASIGGPDYTPAARATSGLPVTFSVLPSSAGVCSMTGGVVSFQGTGTCTIGAGQGGDADWNAAPEVVQGFAVKPTSIAIASVAWSGPQFATSSISSGAFTMTSGATYVVVTTARGPTSLTPTPVLPGDAVPTLIAANTASAGVGKSCAASLHCQLLAWWFTASSTSSSATVSVQFGQPVTFGSLDVLQVTGDNTETPIVKAVTGQAAGCASFVCGNWATTATANLAADVTPGDVAVEVIASDGDMNNSAGLGWLPEADLLYQQPAFLLGGLGVYDTSNPAQRDESVNVSGFSLDRRWQTIAFEVAHS